MITKTYGPCLPSAAVLEGGKFADSRYDANAHASTAEQRPEEEGSRRGWPCRVARQQVVDRELLVLSVQRAPNVYSGCDHRAVGRIFGEVEEELCVKNFHGRGQNPPMTTMRGRS